MVDFGLVREVGAGRSDVTAAGQICGTPETLAPEVLGGAEATPRTDLYALGAVGCFLLTGRPIFDATTAAEFIGAHLHEPPIPPSARRDDVPADLESVLLRCLSKDPADRPANAAALRAELARCRDAGKWTQDRAADWWTATRS